MCLQEDLCSYFSIVPRPAETDHDMFRGSVVLARPLDYRARQVRDEFTNNDIHIKKYHFQKIPDLPPGPGRYRRSPPGQDPPDLFRPGRAEQPSQVRGVAHGDCGRGRPDWSRGPQVRKQEICVLLFFFIEKSDFCRWRPPLLLAHLLQSL